VSQPALALVKGNPDLLLARNATWSDVALFATLVAIAPPALATGYVWVAGRVSRWVGDVLYLVFLGACLVPVAARVVKLVHPGLVSAILLIALVAATGVFVYVKSHAARLFLGYSIVLPLAGVVWFVQGVPALSEDAHAASVTVTSDVPVVFVVMDELPVSSLMTRGGRIDSTRYPNFARLADRSTWFPNATTVHEWTSDAVPALLSGQIGRVSTLPTANHHPETLFSLLGHGYELEVDETMTRLCPQQLCPEDPKSTLENGFGLLRDSWRLVVPRLMPSSVSTRFVQVNSDILLEGASTHSLADYTAFLRGISGNDPDRTLYYSHLLLPHAPWLYLPSGVRYDFEGIDGWTPGEYWMDDDWLVLQGYQRHLLQVGYVDRLLGRLLDRLDRERLFDRSLVIVVADHGASFRAGEGRRPVTHNNLADIAGVPMFVKLPEQRRGAIDARPARTTDLLPTVADVLDVHLPWRVDGTSLLRPAGKWGTVVVARRGGGIARMPIRSFLRDRASTVRAKAAAFGEGRDSLYRIGTNTQLLGTDIGGAARRSTSVAVGIDNLEELAAVRLGSGYLPVRISGRVTSGRVSSETELAIAVNGRIAALTRVFDDNGAQRFRALVPDSTLRNGSNRVDVFAIGSDVSREGLVWLGPGSGRS
jgi:hypothetical protein